MITEILDLFEIQAVLTLAHRLQANALAERNAGEVTRHLRVFFIGQCDAWTVFNVIAFGD